MPTEISSADPLSQIQIVVAATLQMLISTVESRMHDADCMVLWLGW